LELQILSYLWRHGPSKAREVLESLPDGKRRVYTSILSVMQEMEKRGQPAHDVEEEHVHLPSHRHQEAGAEPLASLLGEDDIRGIVRRDGGAAP